MRIQEKLRHEVCPRCGSSDMIGGNIARAREIPLECRVCGHRWTVPIKDKKTKQAEKWLEGA